MVYFIEQLITTYGTDPALTRIADSYEFDLVPVMNVDGFLFGWENDQFRTCKCSLVQQSHPAVFFLRVALPLKLAAYRAQDSLQAPRQPRGARGLRARHPWFLRRLLRHRPEPELGRQLVRHRRERQPLLRPVTPCRFLKPREHLFNSP